MVQHASKCPDVSDEVNHGTTCALTIQTHSASDITTRENDSAGLAGVIRRRWWIILCVTTSCIALAGVYLANSKLVFVSDARVQVRPGASKTVDGGFRM